MTPERPRPKHPKTREKVDKVNNLLADNPTLTLKKIAELMGVQPVLIRKWKSLGWLDHITLAQARRDPDLIDEIAPQAVVNPVLEKIRAEKRARKKHEPPRPRGRPPKYQPPPPKRPTYDDDDDSGNTVSGDVAMRAKGKAFSELSFEELLAMGKDLKMSELRALIKQHILKSLSDSKSVANYATALRQMANVQDVELDEVYEREQLFHVYVPKEDDPDKINILEVDPID